MASRFGYMQVTNDDGTPVQDKEVLSNTRCLMLLLACVRYLADARENVAKNRSDREMRENICALAVNVSEIAEYDSGRLQQDIELLASKLGVAIELTTVRNVQNGMVH